MGIIKVLRRKDAASVVVAIVLGMLLFQCITMLTMEPASRLANIGSENAGSGYAGMSGRTYAVSLVSFVLGVAVLEILILLWGVIAPMLKRGKKS